MILAWMLRRKKWPYAVVLAVIVLDLTIAPAIVAWEIKMLRPYLNP